MSGLFAPHIPGSGQIQASAARGGGGTFGDNANRSITAQGKLGYRRLGLSLNVGIGDAVTGALSNPASDGLFLPPGYNTHSRSASLAANLRLTPHISVHGGAHYALVTGPTTPEQREVFYEMGVRAASGPWTVSLEERYTLGGAGGFDHRVNQVFLQINRTFGTR